MGAKVKDEAAIAQEWEASWWGDCVNTYGEETKQRTYASYMGLVGRQIDGKGPFYDLRGSSVLDIGGGPVSMLLKAINFRSAVVIDPCPYPAWTRARYKAAGITYLPIEGEYFFDPQSFDEVWIYNVLQHVIDPASVIETARKHADILRIFEWVDAETNAAHPHVLTADKLTEWIGKRGTVVRLNENGAVGTAYFGVFKL